MNLEDYIRQIRNKEQEIATCNAELGRITDPKFRQATINRINAMSKQLAQLNHVKVLLEGQIQARRQPTNQPSVMQGVQGRNLRIPPRSHEDAGASSLVVPQAPASPEMNEETFANIDRLEAAAAAAAQALNSGKSVPPAEENEEEENLEIVEEVQTVAKPFSEKDMLCPYSNMTMTTPMKSQNCRHNLDRRACANCASTRRTRTRS